jgi:hypothetical protein
MVEDFLFVNESTRKAGRMSPFDDQNKFLPTLCLVLSTSPISTWNLGDPTSETFDLLEEHDQLPSPLSSQEDETGDSRPPYDLMLLIKKSQSRSHCISSDRASRAVHLIGSYLIGTSISCIFRRKFLSLSASEE